MIGYYVLYSPSQNLENLETDNVITMADLRSVAECVIAAQNAGMNSTSYTDSCVDKYLDAASDTQPYRYVCTTATYSPTPCNDRPAFNYIITYSKQLDSDKHAAMLKVIEKLYQDKGSLGLYQYSLEEDTAYLITADMSGQRVIEKNIFESAGLDSSDYEENNGRLVYIMQYQIPYMYIYPLIAGDKNTCPEGTIAVQRYGRWLCIEANPQASCPHGFALNPATALCDPLYTDDCEDTCTQLNCSSEKTCACYGDGTAECVSQADIPTCPDGYDLTVDPETNIYSCVEYQGSEEASPCSEQENTFVYSNPRATVGNTIRVKPTHCNSSCLHPVKICNTATGAYEFVCLPDATKINSKSCFPDGEASECLATENKGIYFGFTQHSRADGILNNDGNQIVVADLLAKGEIPVGSRDNMFHCKKCDYGINSGESVSPFVTVCKSE